MANGSTNVSDDELVTIRDVAARAGVSVATASRALTGSRRVSEANVALVARAASELGYRRNRIASALRRQVSDTIGLVIPQISNPFFPGLIESVNAELQATHRQLLLCDSMQDATLEAHELQTLVDHQVDGILISPCDADRSPGMVRRAAGSVPLVQLDRRVSGETTDWVGVDDTLAMELVVGHVATQGARSAVFIGSAPSNSSAKERLAAFMDAAATHDIVALPPLLGDFTSSWGVTASQQILAGSALPEAVICANDLIALGLLRGVIRAGVRVPDDLLVTGFDDINAAELSIPSLTTVRQPTEAIAREALRLLEERTAQPDAPWQRVAVAPDLVVRESTGHGSATTPTAATPAATTPTRPAAPASPPPAPSNDET
jgi:LacI family transcriptional regulator